MSKSLLSKAMTFLSLVLLASALHAQVKDAAGAQSAAADPMDQQSTSPQPTSTSKVRIVRLSMVKGAVEINRDGTRGFEKAIANLPVVERNQLRTGVGIAEVEFEDNSSLRLAPNTTVEFPELSRNASGATVSSVHVVQGTAYVSLMKPQSSKTPANEFSLVFGDRKLALDPATHVRLDIQGTEAKLAVLDGSVRMNGGGELAKKKTASFDMFGQEGPKIASGIEKTEFDGWDHDATSYHAKVASVSSNSLYAFNSPYSYGLSDMMYYGSFMNASGCGGMGMMWRPYFASAGWDPFANGTWAWYQGAGYSWVSPYPWAWTPYHYGSWGFCPSVGWGWMPGGSWYGVNNVAALTPAINKGTTGVGGPRLPPPHAPLPHQPSLVAVNMKPLASSSMATAGSSFEFRKDSAGMGVPRETLGRLDKFSNETASHGIARTSVYMSAPQPGRIGSTSMAGSSGLGASIHRGSPPPSSMSQSSSWNAPSSPGGGGGSMSGGARSTSAAPSAGPSAPSGGSRK